MESAEKDLLVVAGEASGDRAAAAVLARLGGARAFGMGGAALAEAGLELVCDLRATTALGVGEVAARACAIALAHRRLLHARLEAPRPCRAPRELHGVQRAARAPAARARASASCGTARRRSGRGARARARACASRSIGWR